MKRFFPIQAVDNFFENPDEVVKFANSLEYGMGNKGDWPGVRTHPLHVLNYPFFNSVLLKIFASFFDYKHTTINYDDVTMYFQKTYPYDTKNKNSILNNGLIHRDGDMPLVGLIYLTKNADLNSGTSIFNVINSDKITIKQTEEFIKRKQKIYKKSFKKMTKKDFIEYEKLVNDVEENFEETIRFNNIYNRLIAYDGSDYHKCNSFYTGQKERLTLVFFVRTIKSNNFYPIQRISSCGLNYV